jgi:tetratricopeptide (TPR) repeat protein
MDRAPNYREILRRGLADAERELGKRLPAEQVRCLCDQLAAHDPAQRRAWLAARGTALGLELVTELIRRARTVLRQGPSVVRAHAELAVEAAEASVCAAGLRPLQQDLRAEAWALLANAHRLFDDYRAAETAWQVAAEALAAGSGDPILAAELAERRASLRTDQRRLPEALTLLEASVRTYRRLGDEQRYGRCSVRLSRVRYFQGELEASLAHALEALAVLEAQEEPQLRALAVLYVAGTLGELGQAAEGLELLQGSWPLFARHATDNMRLRARWTHGRLLRDLGRLVEASVLLEEVRIELLAQGAQLEAALCSLDLALVFARERSAEPQRRLAEEMAPVFGTLGLEQEALAAFLLYVDAARQDAATASLVEGVLEQLEPVRRAGGPRRSRPYRAG